MAPAMTILTWRESLGRIVNGVATPMASGTPPSNLDLAKTQMHLLWRTTPLATARCSLRHMSRRWPLSQARRARHPWHTSTIPLMRYGRETDPEYLVSKRPG